MACVDTVTMNDDSEREEGEIVDDIDELSDISSEEEFLLRQRLQVLESYNHVLERKDAKRTSFGSGYTTQNDNLFLQDLSEISGAELEDTNSQPLNKGENDTKKTVKTFHKQRRKKEPQLIVSKREHKKKPNRSKKKEVKVLSETSEESDDEYRNKRRKLADAVSINISKNDTSTLKARLKKMLCRNQETSNLQIVEKEKDSEIIPQNDNFSPISSINDNSPLPEIHDTHESLSKELTDEIMACEDLSNKILSQELLEDPTKISKFINLCLEDKATKPEEVDTVDSITKINEVEEEVCKKRLKSDSDEDLELLRQHALKTKTSKKKPIEKCITLEEDKLLESSEGEDSDTVELRMICLKSALLKRAIEMKQKQKLQKRLSQSSNIHDEVMARQDDLFDKIDSGNNTDIESVDMDIGSDGDDKAKEIIEEPDKCETLNQTNNENNCNTPMLTKNTKVDEVEEDEDLLRANLLISLSKNLPILVDSNNIANEFLKPEEKPAKNNTKKLVAIEEKKFIINIGDSDSEGEHEATKNLTKMHMKLSEQLDFQQKLDMFLKSTRMEVEKNTVTDVVQKPIQVKATPASPKPAEKFVPKALRHLPKSEQIEYKNLVKRMTELEKNKQARQSSIILNNNSVTAKDMLKPRNISIERSKMPVIDMEQQIALSRKKIAEESAKVLRLKEEATKLSQKYKIVATELRNITTALSLNKKEQKAAQVRLSKVRAEHQVVLKSSTFSKHSKTNARVILPGAKQNVKLMPNTKLQKENNPSKEDYRIPHMQRTVKVSVVNDFKDGSLPNPELRLSVQVDVTSNKKIVKMPKDRTDLHENSMLENAVHEKLGSNISSKDDDYTSPLQALGAATWDADPNAILCPFEVGGNCKDADCKYFHPKPPDQ